MSVNKSGTPRRPWLLIVLVCLAFFAGKFYGAKSAPEQPASRSSPVTYAGTTTYVKPPSTAKPAPRLTIKPKPTATPHVEKYKTTPRAGYELSRTVYVSNSGGKIHLRANCSGMKYYTEMTYEESCEKGYDHCKKCFRG